MTSFFQNSAGIILLVLALFETTGLGAAQNWRPHYRLFKRQARGFGLGRVATFNDARFFPFKVQQIPAPAPIQPCTSTPTTGTSSITTVTPTTPPAPTTPPTPTTPTTPTTPPSPTTTSPTTPPPTSARAFDQDELQQEALESAGIIPQPLLSASQSSLNAIEEPAYPHIEYFYGEDDYDNEDTNEDHHLAHPGVVSFGGDNDDEDGDDDDNDEDDDDDENEQPGNYVVNYNNRHQFARPQVYSAPLSPYLAPIATPRQNNLNRLRRRNRQHANRLRRHYNNARRRRRILRRQHIARVRRQNAQRRYRNRVRQESIRFRRRTLQQERRFRRQQQRSRRRHRRNQNRLINLANRRRRG